MFSTGVLLSLLFTVDSDSLNHAKTSKTEQDDIQECPVATPPPRTGATLTMNNAMIKVPKFTHDICYF